MPYRAYHLMLGIAGVVAVAALLLVRANVDAQARSGPRWKQRLLAAGILLLAAFGTGPACQRRAGQSSPSTAGNTAEPMTRAAGMKSPMGARATPVKTTGPNSVLAETIEWKQITSVTREAEAIAANKRGAYPFDNAGRTKLFADLKTAQQNVDALAGHKLITPGEAGLLKQDLQHLTTRMSSFRPTEMRKSSCYKPMLSIAPATHSLRRLRARLPILKKLAAAKGLHPQLLKRVLAKVEADVAVLEDPTKRSLLKVVEVPKAKQLAAVARAHLVKIKSLLKGAAGKKGK